jgi:hypothetical protein
MILVEGTWLKGPALGMLLMFAGLKPGDFVKVSQVHGAWGLPRGVSKIGIVVDSPYTAKYPRLLLYGDTAIRLCSHGNIRAWMRPPLDLEL